MSAQMATITVMSSPAPHDEDEEISDEQIQLLLEEARARLKTSPGNDKRLSTRTHSTGRLGPRLQTAAAHAPYIHEKDGVARADPKLLISEEQRKLAETLPAIEPAGTSHKTVRKHVLYMASAFHMRKTYPNTSLDADQLSVMDSPAPMKALFS
jgi:hypothetical protein